MARSIRNYKGRLKDKYTRHVDQDGFITYTCKQKHQGLPDEKFSTGSRSKLRKHLMEDEMV